MVQTEDQATTVSMSINGEHRWTGSMADLKTSPEAAAAFTEMLTDAGIDDDPADWPEPDRTTWNDLSTSIHIERRNFLHELRATDWNDDDVTVAVATLTSFRRTEELAASLSPKERQLGDYSDGRWAWQLSNVRKLDVPIPVTGALSLWHVPEDVAESVRIQVVAAAGRA